MNPLFNIDTLPTLPVIAGQVLERLNNPNSSVQDIAEIILKDQSLSSKILQLVNSAFYGFPKRIGTVSHAISILGFETVRGLVLGVSILDTFKIQEFDLYRFWQHSIQSASLMSFLAEKWNYPRKDEAFTIGLIHDVGKLVFMLKAPDAYQEIWSEASCTRLDKETQTFQLNHADLGAQVAMAWNFPIHFIQAIQEHHQQPTLPIQHQNLAHMCYFANLLDHFVSQPDLLSPTQIDDLNHLCFDLDEVHAYARSIQAEVHDFLKTLAN